MACGCFPIATDVGIATQIIRHKENGYIVKERTVEEFRKAIEWCDANIEFICARSSEIAIEMYETRRWEKCLKLIE